MNHLRSLLALEVTFWKERDVFCPCRGSRGQKEITELIASLAQICSDRDIVVSRFFWSLGRETHLLRPLLLGVSIVLSQT